jgi:hypothetical protein
LFGLLTTEANAIVERAANADRFPLAREFP